MSSEFQLKILSPSGIKVDTNVVSVTVPSGAGEIQFLPGHCEFVGLLADGTVTFDAGGAVDKVAVADGTIEFSAGTLTLLTAETVTAQ